MKKRLLFVGIALVVIVGSALLIMRMRVSSRAAEVEARTTKLLDDRYREVYGAREVKGWVRPVLRGQASEENAATAERVAAEKIGKLPEEVVASLSQSIARGVPLTPAAQAAVVDKASVLAELRRGTQGRHAFTHADPRDRSVFSISSSVLGATRLLLASGTLEPAQECVRIGVDAIRIGQDLAPGAFLTSAMVGGAIVEMSVPQIVRCGADLSPGARAEAIAELRVLAENPPPFGEVLDHEWLFMGYGAIGAARDSAADGMRMRAQAWDMVDKVVSTPPDFTEVKSTDYPAAFGPVAVFDHAFDDSTNPLLQLSKPSLLRYAQNDAKTQAWLRALVIALTAQGEHGSLGPVTDAAVKSPSLKDPFTKGPLNISGSNVPRVSLVISSTGPSTGAPDKTPVTIAIERSSMPVPSHDLRNGSSDN
jgi:hypothetical protein